jgi:hypothetical protein
MAWRRLYKMHGRRCRMNSKATMDEYRRILGER